MKYTYDGYNAIVITNYKDFFHLIPSQSEAAHLDGASRCVAFAWCPFYRPLRAYTNYRVMINEKDRIAGTVGRNSR